MEGRGLHPQDLQLRWSPKAGDWEVEQLLAYIQTVSHASWRFDGKDYGIALATPPYRLSLFPPHVTEW